MLKKFLILGLILFPVSAFSATLTSWRYMTTDAVVSTYTPPNTSSNLFNLDEVQVVYPGSVVYFTETGTGSAQNNYTKVLLTSACDSFSIRFHPNIDSITTNVTAEGELYYCAGGQPTATGAGADESCYKITADIDDSLVGIDNYTMTGDPGNAGTDYDGDGNINKGWMQDIPFSLIEARFSTDPPNGVTGAFIGECR